VELKECDLASSIGMGGGKEKGSKTLEVIGKVELVAVKVHKSLWSSVERGVEIQGTWMETSFGEGIETNHY